MHLLKRTQWHGNKKKLKTESYCSIYYSRIYSLSYIVFDSLDNLLQTIPIGNISTHFPVKKVILRPHDWNSTREHFFKWCKQNHDASYFIFEKRKILLTHLCPDSFFIVIRDIAQDRLFSSSDL